MPRACEGNVMLKIFAALLDAARFSRSYQRLARITDDATRARPHDTQETLQQAWAEVEQAHHQAVARQRDLDDDARGANSPAMRTVSD